ncbi:MAG: hypothetical protein ACKO9B_01500 [Planctomycetota bacterium]
MDNQLGRTVRVFLLVLGIAGLHRLVVVPLVEPTVVAADPSLEMTAEEVAAVRARADRRMAALEGIFPADAWERKDPIVLESRQMRLLFRQYNAVDGGRVHLVPCTLVILPDAAEGAAPGRTLVLRAEQGAVLEFDEPLDLRQGRLARLVGGSLRGPVTIRGSASKPGAEDEIEIETRDVELAELEVHTSEAVQFRYGRSTGSGRGLLARLLPKAGAGGQGPNIGGVDSIRLERDVRLKLEGLAGGLLPGPSAPTAAAPPIAAEAAPALVTCSGALVINIGANLVTLEDHVDVVRTLPDGTADQLACDQLAILLSRAADATTTTGGLEPREIQARGRPVVATSAAAALEARGGRLGYEIATRRILLDGEEPVSLVIQGTEMEARSIDYVPGPAGTPGALLAVGPGWLRTRSEGTPPAHVKWQKWLRVRPDGPAHVASLAGAADVTVPGQGRLSAAEMHLWLEPLAAPAAASPNPLSGVRPQRMLARGVVEVDAESLAARTDQLQLWFRQALPAVAAPPPPAPAPAVAPPPSPAAAPSVPVAAAPAAAMAPVVPAPVAPAAAPPAAPPRGRMIAVGALVRGQVVLVGRGAEVEELSMEGQVRLTEESPDPAAAGDAGLVITGDQMQLSRPLRPEARASVSGRPATITGRGMNLEGPLVEFDRGANRMTVDGAGQLRLPLERGLGGLDALAVTGGQPPAAAAGPGALDVRWQGRLDFDGSTARFVDQVRTIAGETGLDAGVLTVTLTRPIDFAALSERRGAGPQADVARIACGNGARLESRSIAADGGRSVERLFVRDLVVDRVSGDVNGTGPGRLTSTRFGRVPAFTPPAAPGTPPVAPAPTAAPTEAQLTFLGVDFQRGLRGNLQRRGLEFHQRVQAIWGPVAAWDDHLDPHAADGLPAGAVSVASDALGIGQAPPLPGQTRSALELVAAGNVMVEGESFTARSARLSWSESKDLLVFEGDGRSDAQLYRQLRVGAPTSSASAGKILFWRALNRVDVDDARYLDFDQLAPGGGLDRLPGLPAPAAARRGTPPR